MTDTGTSRTAGADGPSSSPDRSPNPDPVLPDPKSIVTPDAFAVAPELVGTPLAAPWRRLVAIALDLVLIGFLKLMGWRFVLGGAALMLFLVLVRPSGIAGAGGRPTPLRRAVTGCGGALVLVVTVLITLIPSYVRHRLDERTADGAGLVVQVDAAREDQVGAETQDSAGRQDSAETQDSVGRQDSAETQAAVSGVDVLLDSVLPLFVAAADSAAIAADSARESNDGQSGGGEGSDDGQPRGTAFDWIRDAASEAGLVFGWGTVYITLFLTLWGGRTPGKRALDLRVVRVTGKPLGLLMSFERAGGYAAGFATGLLGFARVWWDPNRQGIHDKIAETVVIRESLPKVPGLWESAARRKIPVAPAAHGASPSSPPTEDAVQ